MPATDVPHINSDLVTEIWVVTVYVPSKTKRVIPLRTETLSTAVWRSGKEPPAPTVKSGIGQLNGATVVVVVVVVVITEVDDPCEVVLVLLVCVDDEYRVVLVVLSGGTTVGWRVLHSIG